MNACFYSRTIPHALTAMLLLAGALNSRDLKAETVNWIPIGSPAARACTSMAYDPATGTDVLFGGLGESHNDLGDTWIWRGGWFPTAPATSPSPRVGSGMAFDGTNIVLFGGGNGSGQLGDTWTWNGINWTQQFPPVSPSPRSTTMVYDAAIGKVLLFGGTDSTNVLGDTWVWDGAAKTWTQQNPTASPSARASEGLAYDAASQTVVLFGGNDGSSTTFSDTWTWNGTSWAKQSPGASPSPRGGAGMTYDAEIGLVVLFGGVELGSIDSFNDTWLWNGTNWTQFQPANVPANRYNFCMDYEPTYKAVLMFGGYSSGPARGGTWLLSVVP